MRCGLIAVAAALSLFTVSSAQADVVKYMTTWANVGGTPLCGADVDANGNVYVVRTGANDVQKFNSSGVVQQTFAGSLNVPTDVAVSSDGSVHVTNVGSSQVVKYSSSGTVAASWACGTSVSLTTDSSGNVYVVDIYGHLNKYSSTGTSLQTWTAPWDASGLALNAAGSVAYTTNTDSALYAIDLTTGTKTTLSTLIDSSDRAAVAVNSATGDIYVASRSTNVIQEFASNGTLVRQWDTWGDAGSQATYSADAAKIGDNVGYRGIAFDGTTNNIYACDLALGGGVTVFNVSVPEPGAVMLMSTGLIGLLAYAWRKRK